MKIRVKYQNSKQRLFWLMSVCAVEGCEGERIKLTTFVR